ncbi:type II toxin-antitoxin system PemK/MazF family toxin [Paramicrobacterium agarici]|uniref:type II toxin-antitoxin system PemK/MazF family toxin n=1 Tax=Paramicrobacterium agarici TaxID=630514 RepID=UPI0011511AF0|nr:type II toxin-antitoxin system PemK/MazF family toxin [Microbacterium agarici]TQO22638.1 mRNA interferase MazF [Microbacterium agarici]
MIRGGIYRIDLGAARGHEQRGRRLGLVMSPTDSLLSVVTVIPTSTSAGTAIHRPRLTIAGRETLVLVDQIRSIDVDNVFGDPVDYLTRDEMGEVENSLAHYLGIVPGGPTA